MSFQQPQRATDYLRHIVNAIENIFVYTKGMDREALEGSLITRDAIMHNLQIIGEATMQLRAKYPAFMASIPDLPWNAMIGMRNRIVHGYFAVNVGVLWDTIESDLRPLRQRLLEVLENEA